MEVTQVTLTAAATQLVLPTNVNMVKTLILQCNGASVRVGDKTVSGSKGLQLASAGGLLQLNAPGDGNWIYWSEFWFFGTAGTVVDVMYIR